MQEEDGGNIRRDSTNTREIVTAFPLPPNYFMDKSAEEIVEMNPPPVPKASFQAFNFHYNVHDDDNSKESQLEPFTQKDIDMLAECKESILANHKQLLANITDTQIVSRAHDNLQLLQEKVRQVLDKYHACMSLHEMDCQLRKYIGIEE